MGGGVRGCAWEEAEEGLPGSGFWGWRGGVSGDLCRNAPLQDQLGQAAGGHRGASRGEGVPQTQSAGSHRGAGAGPHGAGCVGHEGRLRTLGDLCDVTGVQDATGGEGVGGEGGALTLPWILDRRCYC